MPRLPIDYSRTVIYRISCNELPDFIYIGSTTNFVKRKNTHKCYSTTSECKLYQTIRENGGWDNWRITIIEEYPDCKNNIEQRIREQKWIDELNGNLNTNKAYTSKEERKEQKKEHREQNKEHDKQYRIEHKNDKYEYDKQYRQQNKEKIVEDKKEYCKQNREKIAQQRKEHYEQNKEEILQKMKEYREQNKEKIRQRHKKYREKKKNQKKIE